MTNFTVCSGCGIGEDGVDTRVGDIGIVILDDAVFSGCGVSNDITLVSSIGPDDGASASNL